MTSTALLQLPYIASNQNQKHITHNEALRMLDALVQLSVVDRDLSAPPDAPADGARYIVADGASGAWTGWDGSVAAYQDGAWIEFVPLAGWLSWLEDESKLLCYDGAGWSDFISTSLGAALAGGAFDKIGVNATAACAFMAEVVKTQVFDFKEMAGAGKSRADGTMIIRKDLRRFLRLRFDNV